MSRKKKRKLTVTLKLDVNAMNLKYLPPAKELISFDLFGFDMVNFVNFP